jgi:hypothetical protein
VPIVDEGIGKKLIIRGVGNAFSKEVKRVYEQYGKLTEFTYNNRKGKAIVTYEKDIMA